MKALILAAGKGSRLQPLTDKIAKHLIPVANKPIMYYGLEQIKEAGITDIGIVVSPESGPAIKDALGKGSNWGVSITYIIQEEPRGLAHAVSVARDFLGDSTFLLFLGDNLIQDGVKGIVEKFNQNDCEALITLKRVKNPEAFGVAEINPEGRVIKLVEKPKKPQSDLAIVGAYVFKPSVFNAISLIEPSARGEYEITDAIQLLVSTGKNVETYQIEGWWLDTGTLDDLLKANRILCESNVTSKMDGKIDKLSQIEGEVEIGRGSVIINSKINGPVTIAQNVQISNSFIQPYTSIAAKTVVDNSTLENTVILSGVVVKNAGIIKYTIIGHSVILKGQEDQDYSGKIIADSIE